MSRIPNTGSARAAVPDTNHPERWPFPDRIVQLDFNTDPSLLLNYHNNESGNMMIKILYYTSAGVSDPEPDPELTVSDRNTKTSY
jgi:hypothetical protein